MLLRTKCSIRVDTAREADIVHVGVISQTALSGVFILWNTCASVKKKTSADIISTNSVSLVYGYS